MHPGRGPGIRSGGGGARGELEKEASWKGVGASPVATRDLKWSEQRRHRHAPAKGGGIHAGRAGSEVLVQLGMNVVFS